MAISISPFWKVILGNAWDLAKNGLEPGLFMILRRDGSTDRVSEDGTNTANDTTNRLKVEITQDDYSYFDGETNWPYFQWNERWYVSNGGSWAAVGDWPMSYGSDHEYTGHEFWQGFYDYADFYGMVTNGFTSSGFYETYWNINYNSDFFSTRTDMPNKAYYKLNTTSIIDRSTSDTPVTLTIKNVGVATGSISLSANQSWIEFYVGSDTPTATLTSVSVAVGDTLTVNVLVKAGAMPNGFDLANITITDASADNTPFTVQVIQGRNVHSTYRLMSTKSPKIESNFWDYGASWANESADIRGPFVIGPYDDGLVDLGDNHGDIAFWTIFRLPVANKGAVIVSVPTHGGGNGATVLGQVHLAVNTAQTAWNNGAIGEQAGYISIIYPGEYGGTVQPRWYAPEINDCKPHTIGLYCDRYTAWRRVPDGSQGYSHDGYVHASIWRLFIDGVERLPYGEMNPSSQDVTVNPWYTAGSVTVDSSVNYGGPYSFIARAPLTKVVKAASRPGTLWTDHLPIAAFWGTANSSQKNANEYDNSWPNTLINISSCRASSVSNPVELAWCTVFRHIDRTKVVKGMKYIHDAAKVSETALNTAMTAVGTRVGSYKLTETITDSAFGTLTDASPAGNNGRLSRAEDCVTYSMRAPWDPSDGNWLRTRFNVNGSYVMTGQTELTAITPRRPGGYPTMIPTGTATMTAPASLLETDVFMRYLIGSSFVGDINTGQVNPRLSYFGSPKEPTNPATYVAADQFPTFPAGDYKVTYVGPGAFHDGGGNYRICGYSDEPAIWVAYVGGVTPGIVHSDGASRAYFAGNAPIYGSAAACAAGEAGKEVIFTHAGGKIGIIINAGAGQGFTNGGDLTKSPYPVYKLTSASSGGGPTVLSYYFLQM